MLIILRISIHSIIFYHQINNFQVKSGGIWKKNEHDAADKLSLWQITHTTRCVCVCVCVCVRSLSITITTSSIRCGCICVGYLATSPHRASERVSVLTCRSIIESLSLRIYYVQIHQHHQHKKVSISPYPPPNFYLNLNINTA